MTADRWSLCAICGKWVRLIPDEPRPVWVHSDPTYSPFASPIHAAEPSTDQTEEV
jgi:hypothetical protein